MSSKIGIGVIGVGLRGQHSYEQILRNDPRVDVRAVSVYPDISGALLEGKDESFFKEYAADLGAEYMGEDYKALLARYDIELISLMCEPGRALELGQECFEAGKNVLRDKPVCRTSEDAFALQDAAEQAGKQLLFAMPLRYHQPLIQVHQNITGGAIGDIISVNMSYVWASGPLAGFNASQESLDCYGGGDVTIAGCHAIDYLNWLIDSKPLQVYCEQDSFFYDDYKAIDMDDFGQIVIEYESGAVATLITGRVPSRKGINNWLDVTGTAGAIELRDFASSIRLEGQEEQRCVFDNDPLNNLAADMLDCLEKEKRYPCTATDGGLALAVLEAASKSAASHHVEKVVISSHTEELILCSR